MKVEKDSELDQATLRIIVAGCALVWFGVIGFLPGQDVDPYVPVMIYISLFMLGSIVLRMAIARWPGHYPARRILGMVYDYTGTCYGLVVGGEGALPIYAVMVWVNLGNGMRFGSRYLAIATVLALFALFMVYLLTPYWQAQPYMVLMLMITSTVIPVYAHILLKRTRLASEEAIAANLEKSRFLAQASHDLRQPIHSIGLFTACLREASLGGMSGAWWTTSIVRCSTSRSCSARSSTSTPWTTGECSPSTKPSTWANCCATWYARIPRRRAGPVSNYGCGPAPIGCGSIRGCWRPWCRTCCPTASSTPRNDRC